METYRIPASRQYGWVTVEYSLPDAKPARHFWIFDFFNVPASGSVKTSDRSWMGWLYTRFTRQSADGWAEAVPHTLIHRQESILLHGVASGVVGAFHFFYGPAVTGDDLNLISDPRFREDIGTANGPTR